MKCSFSRPWMENDPKLNFQSTISLRASSWAIMCVCVACRSNWALAWHIRNFFKIRKHADFNCERILCWSVEGVLELKVVKLEGLPMESIMAVTTLACTTALPRCNAKRLKSLRTLASIKSSIYCQQLGLLKQMCPHFCLGYVVAYVITSSTGRCVSPAI